MEQSEEGEKSAAEEAPNLSRAGLKKSVSEIEISTLKWLQNQICNENLLLQGFHWCKIKRYCVSGLLMYLYASMFHMY